MMNPLLRKNPKGMAGAKRLLKSSLLFVGALCILTLASDVQAQTTAGLISHWKFDEGSGTTAADSVGSNTGTLINGPTWTSGVLGQALSFDGTDDQAAAANESVFDFTTDFSLSVWVKTSDPGYQAIMGKFSSSGTGWDLGVHSGELRMTLRGTSNLDTGNGGANSRVDDSQWHHIAAVNTNSSITLYIDGTLDVQKTGTWTPTLNDNPFRIGNRDTNPGTFFNGLIDDVRIYNRALSASEVAGLYNAATPTASLTANPTSVTSGQSSTLSWSSTNATSCTGTGFSTGNAVSGSLSVSPTQTTAYAVSCTGAIGSAAANATVEVATDPTPPSVPSGLTATAVSTSQINLSWNASTDNTGVTGYDIYRGGTLLTSVTGTSYQNTGLSANTSYTYTVSAFDDARNKSAQSTAVSATTQSTSVGGIISHWKFDEGSGTTAADSVGSNTGTLINGPTWTSGVLGQALSFDGTDDQAAAANESVFDFTTDFSLSVWVKTPDSGFQAVLGKYTSAGTGWDLGISAGEPRMAIRGTSAIDTFGTANIFVSDNQWHHIVAVNTNSSITLYVDGTLDVVRNGTWTATTNNEPVRVGNRNTNPADFFTGAIDDVRIYNRALSASEIADLYNAANPTASLSANPASITSGQSSTLTWSSTNATSCTGTGFWTGSAVSGSVSVSPTQTTTYSVSCTGAGGTASANVTVNVSIVSSGPTQSPYGGAAWSIPGTIQAEDFDEGGEGVAYHDTTSGNSPGQYRASDVDIKASSDIGGGYAVGWTSPGEWQEYSVNVTQTGSYTFTARVATILSSKSFHMEIDGVDVTGAIAVPVTATSWDTTYGTVSKAGISLTAGTHVIRIFSDTDSIDFNYFTFTLGTSPAAKFGIGDRVYVSSGPLNIRSTPSTSGTILGTQASGGLGAVVDGPTVADGYTWWNIDYDLAPDGWSIESSLELSVASPPPPSLPPPPGSTDPPPTASLSANPASITSGQSSTLTWSSTNATSCTGSGFSTGSAVSGSVSVSPTMNATYSISCSGAGGPASANATVTVSAAADTTPPSISISSPTTGSTFTTTSSSITLGGSASDNTGVTSVTYQNSVNGSASGCTGQTSCSWTTPTIPLNQGSNIITVTASDAAGNSATDSISVTYSPPDTTPPAEITALAVGDPDATSLMLSWSAPGDDGASGTAVSYAIKRSTVPPSDAATWWNAATLLSGAPTPSAAGNSQTYIAIGLSSDTTYYFAIRATDDAGNQGPISLSSIKSGKTLDVTGPILSSLQHSAVTTNGASITWTTNEPATSAVDYGTTLLYGKTAQDLSSKTSHSILLSNLLEDTIYHYRVRSADASGNQTASADGTFTTLDATPPAAIANLSAANITENAAMLSWSAPGDNGTVGTTASYDVRYSTTPITDANFSAAPQVQNPPAPKSAGSTETLAIGSLASATTYYAAIKTTDEAGNTSGLSNVTVFTTVSPVSPGDVAAPVVSNVIHVYNDAALSASISWTTNEPADSEVWWNESRLSLDNQVIDESLVTSHSLTISGLAPKTKYDFQVRSKDASENQTVSQSFSFNTNPGKPSKVQNLQAAPGSIILTWVLPNDPLIDDVFIFRSPASPLTRASVLERDFSEQRYADHLATIADASVTTYRDIGVIPSNTYYYTVFTRSTEGIFSDPAVVSISLQSSSKIKTSVGTLVPAIPELTAVGADTRVVLTWENPVDPNYVRTVIVRKEGDALPTSISDGIAVYEGTNTTFIDENLDNSNRYTYAAFALNRASLASSPTSVSLKAASGETVSSRSPGAKPAASLSATNFDLRFTRYLGRGIRGDDVRALQRYLIVSSFLAPGNDTGYFGPLTEAAVQRFQAAEGIVSSGDPDSTGYGGVGPRTRAALNSLIQGSGLLPYSASPAASRSSAAGSGALTRSLWLGVEGEDVRLLQQLLNQKGYQVAVSGPGSPGNESTYFGPLTRAALVKFQCAVLQVCDGDESSTGFGNVGPRTRAALNNR